jgi:hypothetical protein
LAATVSDKRAGLVAALEELADDAQSGRTSNWENVTLASYLEALAAWLRVYEHAYTNSGKPVPSDAWEVMTVAVRAATKYE